MARRTKFQPNDLVRVRYRTRQMNGIFYGKVIEYVPDQRAYTVGLLAQEGHRVAGVVTYAHRPLAVQYAVLCNTAEMELADEAAIAELKNVSYLKQAMSHVHPWGYHKDQLLAALSCAMSEALRKTEHIPNNADLTSVDVSGYALQGRHRWFSVN